jgi:hypothetical protein
MRIRVGVPDEHVTPEVVEPVLEAVTRLNEHMIRTGQTPTSHELIQRGAIWRPENMGDEHFDHGGTIAQRGWGDCDDWAPLHAATLRANGTDPGAHVRMVESGPNTFHALVQRSNGAIEDPSIAAGMKSSHPANISGGESMQMWACDPHDGRIYQGAALPTVGPLSLHCGPGVAVRGCMVHGHGPLYEARVDVPIDGSRLVHVKSYMRRRGHHHKRVCGSVLPYAISVTHYGQSRGAALRGAIVGAICCGDASEMTSPLDRYKLLALQSAGAGMSPGQVRTALERQIHHDVHMMSSQTGFPPEHHAKELLAHTSGGVQYLSGPMVGSIFSDIGDIASSVVSDVGKVASAVAKTVGPWVGTILHGVEAVASLVPGLGTAVSDIVAAAETAYDAAAALIHGNPLEAGIRAAYNFATATIPGAAAIRFVLDPVVTALIDLTVKKEPVETAILDGILNAVPDAPKIGPISPRSIAASLAHLIINHLGAKDTGHSKAPKSTPMTAGQAAIMAKGLAHLPGAAGVAAMIAKAVPVTKPTAKPPPKPPPVPVKVVPMVLHPTTAKVAPHLVSPMVLKKPVTVPTSLASKPLGIAHSATHKVTLQSVNAMVQHV